MQDDEIFKRRVIDLKQRKRRVWLVVTAAIIAGLLLFGSRLVGIYIDALWFSSIGYSEVYWYKFKLGGLLFAIFLAGTFVVLKLSFALLGRAVPELTERPKIRLATLEDIRDVNILPFLYRPGVWLLSAVIALMFAVSMSQEWPKFALYLNKAPAGVYDPIFGKDVSFYLFTLPIWELMSGWLLTVTIVLFLAVAAVTGYVWYYERAQGFATTATRRRLAAALSLAGATLATALAFSTYLERFDLLVAQHQLFTGATYTDANVRLPGLNVLAVILVLVAGTLVVNGLVFKKGRLMALLAVAVVAAWIFGVLIIPQGVYSFSVKPNELAKESPFIHHNIEMTRIGFAIDRFEERPFNPAPSLTAEQIQLNRPMLNNIRLWDRQVLQATLGQIQEIRTYYKFYSPDVDRYIVNGKLRQVILAARELDVDKLPEKTWINEHLVYTHGYGVTMSTVNEFTPEGLPHLLLKNMPVESEAPEIKVTRPEVYFGELSDWHVYVHTRPQGATQPEFNYPAPGSADSYTEYEGKAGIRVGGLLRKAALALYLGDGTNLLFSDYIGPESRLLLRRAVQDRVRQVAPFLLFDEDAYLVIGRDGKLYWIIDAFTYSDRYPFSTPYWVANQRVNYIRNSVKVVVDAYEGGTRFYIFDPDDPVIKTYRSVFPGLFRSSEDMPEDLREHIRLPTLLLKAQATAYTVYHMRNPQTFYNHEDLWAIPSTEPATQQGAEPEPMQPYHLLMALPGQPEDRLEYVTILPFTPAGQGRNNMIGWMAARNDAARYGHTLVFSFPKNLTVNGPAQIRARVNQDPQLSAQMTLWNQQGSRVIRGSLLVIPMAGSLLYIEPFYLRAENSPLPELRQVAVATQERLATGKTFDEALKTLFPQLPSQPAPAAAQPAQPPPQLAAESRPAPSQQQPAKASEVDRLSRQAQQLLSEYERLTAEGKHREAGEKLDQLKQTLANLIRTQGGS